MALAAGALPGCAPAHLSQCAGRRRIARTLCQPSAGSRTGNDQRDLRARATLPAGRMHRAGLERRRAATPGDAGLEDGLADRDLIGDFLPQGCLVTLARAFHVAEGAVETHPALDHPGAT